MSSVKTRVPDLSWARRLSIASVLWNAVSGSIATFAGLKAGSSALVGFGLDAGLDGCASLVLIWRFTGELRAPHRGSRLENRTAMAIGILLWLIAAYVALRAIQILATSARPQKSLIGLSIEVASVVALPPLALAKRRTANRIKSQALRGDSVLTAIGAALAAIAMVGVALNQAFGWWWADSLAALFIAAILIREGFELIFSHRSF
jgi:divalent metal cation (Fe/Co/Zn/Cd) transporter